MDEIYRFKLGDFACTVIHDENGTDSPARLFADVPEAEREAALAAKGMSLTEIELSYNVLLVEANGQRLLLDSGNGVETGGEGRLLPVLEQHNIPFDSITMVILSHAHADHYAGMLTAAGEKIFPNAQYVMFKQEWEYYTSADRLAFELTRDRGQERMDFINKYFLPLQPYLTLIDEAETEIAPGVRLIPAAGHTKHHLAVELESQGEVLLYVGDGLLHPIFVEHLPWSFTNDFYKDEVALNTRRSLLERAATKQAILFAYHFPFPGLGRVQREGEGYRYQSLK